MHLHLFLSLFLCIPLVVCPAEQETPSRPAPGFYCSHCGQVFPATIEYYRHTAGEGIERSYECSECHLIVSFPHSLVTHLRTHTGERPYACSYCPQQFTDFSTRRNHERIHTGEKPFSCLLCKQDFRQQGQFSDHLISPKHRSKLKKPSPVKPMRKEQTFIRLGDQVFKVPLSLGVNPHFPSSSSFEDGDTEKTETVETCPPLLSSEQAAE
jgi:hypothetical protein